MRRLIYVLSALLALTVLAQVDLAKAEEGHHSIGVQAGEVGLSGDVGNAYNSNLGYGAFFNYAVSDFLEFQLNYHYSHHSNNGLNLTQNAYEVAAVYDVDQWDVFTPYIEGGAEFVNHVQDVINSSTLTAQSVNSTGFGLDFGVGAKVDLGRNFMTGLDFTYHSIFPVTVTPTGGAGVTVIQDYYTVMLRFGFSFGASGGSYLNRPDKPLAP